MRASQRHAERKRSSESSKGSGSLRRGVALRGRHRGGHARAGDGAARWSRAGAVVLVRADEIEARRAVVDALAWWRRRGLERPGAVGRRK